jgi:membrane associated rhomboid family serine protease
MALCWALSTAKPYVIDRLMLDMSAVRRGEVWRLVTFLFIPPSSSIYWILFNLYFTWWIGSSLEEHWGAFKFNVYYFVGALGTIVAASIAGPQGSTFLNSSMFLAFAALFPDVTILLFFLLPIRVKWLGLLVAGYLVYSGFIGDWATRGAILAALGNYFLFFGGHWWAVLRAQGRTAARPQRRQPPPLRPSGAPFGERVCAMCGAKEAEGADIRVCSCEKCGRQPRSLCLEHARNH